MNKGIAITVLLSAIALLIADSENWIIGKIFHTFLKIGNKQSIQERLMKLGKRSERDFENFRIAQLALVTTILSVEMIFFLTGIFGVKIFFIFSLTTVIWIFFVTDRNLTNRCKRRAEEIESEFPSVVELLTLAVGAGESPVSAIKRISMRAHGHLAAELKKLIDEVESGATFISALDHLSYRVGSDSLRRFVDSIAISMTRGTPLVDTLAHLATEARNQERARLLRASGKAEISMMIPVVFLILPISIIFALYPSLNSLELFNR